MGKIISLLRVNFQSFGLIKSDRTLNVMNSFKESFAKKAGMFLIFGAKIFLETPGIQSGG